MKEIFTFTAMLLSGIFLFIVIVFGTYIFLTEKCKLDIDPEFIWAIALIYAILFTSITSLLL